MKNLTDDELKEHVHRMLECLLYWLDKADEQPLHTGHKTNVTAMRANSRLVLAEVEARGLFKDDEQPSNAPQPSLFDA